MIHALVLLLLSGSAFADEALVSPTPTPLPETKVTVDGNTILAQDIGLKVTLPKEWRPIVPVYQNRAVFIDYKGDKSSFAVEISPSNGLSAQEGLETTLKLNEEHEAAPSNIERGIRKVGSLAAVSLTFSKKTKAGVYRREYTALNLKHETVLFTCSNFEAEFEKTRAACKKILDQAVLKK